MAFLNRIWVTAIFIGLFLISLITFWLITRPLISMETVNSISQEQFKILNIPSSSFFSSINLVWYNSGRFLSFHRVYVVRVSYQSYPGSDSNDVEILIDARNGNILSEFMFLHHYPPILLGS